MLIQRFLITIALTFDRLILFLLMFTEVWSEPQTGDLLNYIVPS